MPAAPASRLLRLARPLLDALAAPHGIDRYLEQWQPLWSLSDLRAVVVSTRRETADCTTLVLRPNGRWGGFKAGQYVRVGVEIGGVRRTRCYSINRSEHAGDGLITITVRREPDGLVSTHLHERAAAGDVLTLSQAEGDFCLPATRPQRLLLISGGSGITPVMGLLRTLCDEGHGGRIDFLHYARTPQDQIYAAELQALAQRHPNLHLHLQYTRAGAAHFAPEWLAARVPQLEACETYVCGPAALIDAVSAAWSTPERAGRLHVERFVAARAASPAAEAGGELRFARSERLARNDGRTLLDQAEAAGLKPQSGCRMGICHSCTCRKTAGSVRNLRTGVVSTEADEDIQLCISVPVGDVTLAL